MSEQTIVSAPCGCSVTLRKTCDCPNAAQVDVTKCAIGAQHEAAPDLLAALTDIGHHATFDAQNPNLDSFDLRGALRAITEEADAAIAKAKLPA